MIEKEPDCRRTGSRGLVTAAAAQARAPGQAAGAQASSLSPAAAELASTE